MIAGRFRNLALMVADAVCVAVCWIVVVLGYHALGGRYDPCIYLRFWPIVPAFLGLNVLFRLYHGNVFYPAAPLPPVEELRRLVGSSVLLHCGTLAALALLHQTTQGYSRVVIVASGILVAALAQFVRDAVRWALCRLRFGQIPVVIVGSGATAQRLVKALSDDGYSGLAPVGYFDDGERPLGNVPRWGGLRDVVSASRAHRVSILLACEDARLFRCQLCTFTDWFTYIEYFPSAEVFPVFGSRTISFGGIGGLEMVNQDRMRELRLEKWLLDKVLSTVVFVLTSPLLLIIGVLVRLTSPGPMFFRHKRIGRYGKSIRIWKFRTMYRDAGKRLKQILAEDPKAAEEWAQNFKLKDDPRITPFGRFLRKTSLDELPQIFNVLGGSMTLVGPRPIVEEEKRYYGAAFDIFSSVKPGVTGLWQVSGRSDTGYERRVALDSYYILNWSPWLDLWILMRTAVSVLLMQGAR